MNDTDRKRMGRLYSCMAKLPWPNRGRTLSPADLSQFFADMEALQPQFMRCVMAISRCDVPSEDPAQELDDLEESIGGMTRDG